MRLGPLTLGTIAILGMVTGCHSSTPAAGSATSSSPTFSSLEQADKYQWLGDVAAARSMAWVREQNTRTAKVLESYPRFNDLKDAALKVYESPGHLAIPILREGTIYNTWQDAQHVRGILRRTSLSDYLSPNPKWQTVLDYDALAKQDKQEWVANGLNCLYPGNFLCLVSLSAGGEDAETLREFNLKTGKFVEHGFVLPHSKQDVSWLNQDALLVARDWGAGTMTRSGYPYVVKLWRRGQPLDQAKEVFRGAENNISVQPETLNDGQGHHVALIDVDVSTFDSAHFLWTPTATTRLALPAKVEVEGLLDNQLIVQLNQDWTPDWKPDGLDKIFPQGSVISLNLDAVKQDPEHLKPTTIFAPTAVEFAQEVQTTRDHLVLTTLEHVQGRAYIYTLSPTGEWLRKRLDLPDNQTVDILPAAGADDRFFLEVQGFLTPPSLLLGDPAVHSLQNAKSLKPQFDASHDVVDSSNPSPKTEPWFPTLWCAPRICTTTAQTQPC